MRDQFLISDRLLLARFAHKHGHLSIIVVYAPTDPSEDHNKDNFYNQLSAATQSIPPRDILIVLGDFNASSGTYDNVGGVLIYRLVLGPQTITQIV